MCRTETRHTPVGLLCFLAVICVTAPFVVTHEAEIHGWDSSQGKRADALDSLFSNLEIEKLQALLKNIPPAELRKVASQVVGDISASHPTELEKRRSILKAIKEKGLLESWKEDLESLIFDDNALPTGDSDDKAKKFQNNLKCNEKHGDGPSVPHGHHNAIPEGPLSKDIKESVDQLLGISETNGTPSSVKQDHIHKNDVDYLLQVAEDELDEPAEKLLPPKQDPVPYQSIKKPSSSDKRKESNKKPYKKEEPLDALVGMAKKLLGQEGSNPTLDIVANMASAYIKNMDHSGKKKNANSGPDLSAMLQMASLFSGGNAGQDNPLQSIMSLLGNSGMDVNQLLQMGSALMGNGLEAPASRKNNKSSNPFAEMLIRIVANFLNMDSVVLLDYYNGLTKLTEAKSWNEINAILRKTTGMDVETTLDLLVNDDVRQQLSDSATSSLAHWLQEFLDPDSIQNKITYLNAFAFQNKYPLVDSKNFVESLSVLVERLSEDYLNTKINLRPYLKQSEKQINGLLHVDGSERLDFRKLSEEELAMIIQNTMKNEVFDPLAELWTDFRYASRFPKCARTIVCLRNVPSNSVRSSQGLKQGVTRAMSTVVVWALSKTNNRGMPAFDVLYKAAFDGTTDCEAKYRENCNQILNGPLPSMRLDYEHHEL